MWPVLLQLRFFRRRNPYPIRASRMSDCIEGLDRALVADIVRRPRRVRRQRPQFGVPGWSDPGPALQPIGSAVSDKKLGPGTPTLSSSHHFAVQRLAQWRETAEGPDLAWGNSGKCVDPGPSIDEPSLGGGSTAT